MASYPDHQFHRVDGIFVHGRGPRVFLDVIFGVFVQRAAEKVEDGVEAPQPEIAFERVFPAEMAGTDVEGDIVQVAVFRLIDQPRPFLG